MANTYNIKVTGTLDTSKIQEALKGVEQKYGNVKIGTGAASGIKSIGTAAKESKGMLGEFTSQLNNLSSTIPKVAAFGVATMAVNAFRDAIADGVQQVIEYDKSIEELEKVVGAFTNEELKQFSSTVADIGEELSATMTDVTNAVTTFVKTGATLEESIDLSKVAIQMQHTADETLEASTAAETLIAVMRAYGATSDDASHVADAINNVSANFAISSGQIITNIGKVAATMATGNTTLEQTLGLITGITEVTRNASKASNALKTIGQRLRGVGEDAEEGLTAKLQGVFDEYQIGIQIMDEQTGKMASTFDILSAIASRWDSLTEAQRQNLGELAAGKNRITEFNALMINFDNTLAATEAAYNSAGVTAQQFGVYQESIEGKLNALKEQWQELVAEGGGINKFIKLIIDAGVKVLQFANSDLGKLIINFTALGFGVKGLINIFPKLLGLNLVSWGKQFATILATAGTSATSLQFALQGLTQAVLASPLFWTAIGGLLIFELPKLLKTDEEKFNELKDAVEETNQAISSTQSEYDQLSSKGIDNLTSSERQRLTILEQQLQILKEQKLEQEKLAYEAMPKSSITIDQEGSMVGGDGVGGGLGVGVVQLNKANVAAQDYIKTLDTLNDVNADVKKSLADTAEQLLAFQEAGVALNEADQEFLETYGLLIDANNLATESFEQYGNVVGNNVTQAMDALTSAIRVQNEQGYINEEIKNNLLALYPQLTDQITQQGNGYLINTSALSELINAENIEQISINQSKKAAIDYINTLGGEKLAYSATIDAIKKAITARLQDAKSRMAAGAVDAAAYNKMTKAQKDEYLAGQAVRAAASSEYSRLQGILSNFNTSVNSNTYALQGNTGAVSNNTGAVSNYGGATQSATSATKSNTSATKANTDAQEAAKKAHDELVDSLKDVADAYKTAAKYMASQIEIEINTLEKRKDAIEESYDAQIQAIQDANDAIEEQMELEKAQQALAEAKKKRQLVFTGGQFQYVEDAQAIAEAQENLNNVVRQQEMEQQVQNLENARDAELRAIDDQIVGWEKYKEQWESLADSYQEQQDKLIAQQILGIKLEGDNWQKRLTNAQAFVDQYKKIMAQLDVLEGSDTSTPQSAKTVLNQAKTLGTKGFANGTTSTPAGIYKVGEAGSELMVGRGNGVIPHNLTENLMKLGQFSPSEWVNSIRGIAADRNQTVVQQFGDISLPNVSNASQFVEQLKQFKNYAVQATSRR